MCDFFNQLVWLVSARFTSLKSKKYTLLKFPKCKAKATIGMVPQIKADSLRFFENDA